MNGAECSRGLRTQRNSGASPLPFLPFFYFCITKKQRTNATRQCFCIISVQFLSRLNERRIVAASKLYAVQVRSRSSPFSIQKTAQQRNAALFLYFAHTVFTPQI